jgi:hypothetical protein
LVPFGEDALALNTTTTTTQSSGVAPRLWRLWSIAPVLEGGWVLVGEQDKFVRVSPQRIMADTTAASSSRSPSSDNSSRRSSSTSDVVTAAAASDAVNATAELGADGSGLAFRVLGAPHEVVRLTLVAPNEPLAGAADGGNSSGSSSSSVTAVAAIANGQVLVIEVPIPVAGVARVQCRTGRGPLASSCAITSNAAGGWE